MIDNPKVIKRYTIEKNEPRSDAFLNTFREDPFKAAYQQKSNLQSPRRDLANQHTIKLISSPSHHRIKSLDPNASEE